MYVCKVGMASGIKLESRDGGAGALAYEALVKCFDAGVLVRYTSDILVFFFFQAEDGIRDLTVTRVQTCALPILGEDEGDDLADHHQLAVGEVDHLHDAEDQRDARGQQHVDTAGDKPPGEHAHEGREVHGGSFTRPPSRAGACVSSWQSCPGLRLLVPG